MGNQYGDLDRLQQNLGYAFRDLDYLQLALTHRSLGHQPQNNNERLEFLGDAVLQLTVSTYLYRKHPKLPEGELAKIRSLLVRESTLAEIARELELNHFLLVGKGEQRSQAQERDSLLCDVLEAVYGAVYLDGGFAEAERVILRHLPDWDGQQIALIDAKSTLQEHYQQIAKKPPVYTLVQEQGPDHDKSFVVEVWFEEQYLGRGTGRSKKEAEQEAARAALGRLGIQGEKERC
ncbi:MAG: ribonuclease III [Firmicutes bacterium]|nr:ribonuclease III [Bacillota bacterium]